MGSPADASSLCIACGLCCGWSMFGHVGLTPGEAEWAASRRLPLVEAGAHPALRLPCTLLEVRGDQRICGDYDQRPIACKTFECSVLARYKRQEILREEAMALVRRGQALVEGIERRTSSLGGGRLVLERLAELSDAFDSAAPAERAALDPELLLDVAAARSLITREFARVPPAGNP